MAVLAERPIVTAPEDELVPTMLHLASVAGRILCERSADVCLDVETVTGWIGAAFVQRENIVVVQGATDTHGLALFYAKAKEGHMEVTTRRPGDRWGRPPDDNPFMCDTGNPIRDVSTCLYQDKGGIRRSTVYVADNQSSMSAIPGGVDGLEFDSDFLFGRAPRRVVSGIVSLPDAAVEMIRDIEVRSLELSGGTDLTDFYPVVGGGTRARPGLYAHAEQFVPLLGQLIPEVAEAAEVAVDSQDVIALLKLAIDARSSGRVYGAQFGSGGRQEIRFTAQNGRTVSSFRLVYRLLHPDTSIVDATCELRTMDGDGRVAIDTIEQRRSQLHHVRREGTVQDEIGESMVISGETPASGQTMVDMAREATGVVHALAEV